MTAAFQRPLFWTNLKSVLIRAGTLIIVRGLKKIAFSNIIMIIPQPMVISTCFVVIGRSHLMAFFLIEISLVVHLPDCLSKSMQC